MKDYVEKCGKTVLRFKNDLSGKRFAGVFVKHYSKALSLQLTQNIKKARALVSYPLIN